MNSRKFNKFQYAIDPSFLEEAYAPARKIIPLKAYISIAACFAVIVSSFLLFSLKNNHAASAASYSTTSANENDVMLGRNFQFDDETQEEKGIESYSLFSDASTPLTFPDEFDILEQSEISDQDHEYKMKYKDVSFSLVDDGVSNDHLAKCLNLSQDTLTDSIQDDTYSLFIYQKDNYYYVLCNSNAGSIIFALTAPDSTDCSSLTAIAALIISCN